MSKVKSTSTDKKKKSSTETEIRTLIKQNKAAKKTLKDNTKKTISLLKTLIQETPEILAIRWSQYVPSFNDGQPCEFSVNDLEIKFNPDLVNVNKEKIYYDRGEEQEQSDFIESHMIDEFFESQMDIMNFKQIGDIEKKVKLFHKIHKELSAAYSVLEDVFGINVQITLTKEGIEKEHFYYD